MEISVIYVVGYVIVLCLFLLYFYLSRNQQYWQNKGIPCAKNIRPILGNVPVINYSRCTTDMCIKMYKDHPAISMIGFYNYNIPCLLIRDPKIVKDIKITKFSSFFENDHSITKKDEPLLAKNPFFINDVDEWKICRSKLTTSFTGNKLKIHTVTIQEVMKKLTNYVDEQIAKSKRGYFEVEAKGLTCKITGEICANVGFGVEGHCFDDSKAKENFVHCGQLLFDQFFKSRLITMVLLNFPLLLKPYNIKFIPDEFEALFKQLIRRALENRKLSGQENRYFIDFIMEQEEKEGNLETRDQDVTSHMLNFFLDMYETTSTMTSFVCYSVAAHKHIQQKVRSEVVEILQKHGALNYDAMNDLVYLEQVIYETMRIYPVISTLTKKCTESVELVGSDGMKVSVDPGIRVFISVDGLHMDPQIWEDPETFRPERFGRESASERIKNVYLPFGEGPRICPGRKVAMVVMKIAIASLLINYDIELSEKTQSPLQFDPQKMIRYVKGGIWINIRKSKNN